MTTKRWEALLDRRHVLALGAQSGLALLMTRCATGGSGLSGDSSATSASQFMRNFGPIDRSLGDKAPQQYFGDSFARPHEILWNLPGYLANKKIESEEQTNLVVIGGGMSGLFTTYRFRSEKPILLEQAARFGGNAKGQSWRGMDYSIGAAYIDVPEPETPMYEYYRELQLDEFMVERNDPDPIAHNGKLYHRFWEGETEPQHKAKYAKLAKFFTELAEEKKGAFPEIPSLNAEQLKAVKYYDRYDLHTLLSKVAGGLTPHLETAFEHYCWSTYGGSSKELSAAAALNFLAKESQPIGAAAGGNARIGERLLERINAAVPASHLRCGAVVVQVKVDGNRVRVLYEDAERRLRAITAKSAVLCCPKFVAARLLHDIEAERLSAIKKLRYRSYMTASVLLNKRATGNFYDLFMLGSTRPDFKNIQAAQDRINATDFVLGNFASPSDKISVLTLYRAFPFDGARPIIFDPKSYQNYRTKFARQIEREILPLIKLSPRDIVDLRLTAWGHALPLCAKGLYSDDTIPRLRAPFKNRVFFVEQDNWAYPATLTGATDVALMHKQILAALRS